MQSFRSWSRRAWLLHGYLLAMLILQPMQRSHATWVDTDSDGTADSWADLSNPTQSLAQLNAISLDIDADGAYNDEELAYGSDPLDYDTDNDGLNDGDEIHLAIEQGGKSYSLTVWDSNGDEVSDFDDFYGFYSVTYPGGNLPPFSGASYSDYDGDGIKNPFDTYPADPTNNDADGDGLDDSVDPAPGDASNTSSYNSTAWGGNALGDADYDAILNFWDAYPYDSTNGSNDSDGDGIENSSDPFPSDYANYSSQNGINWYSDVFGDADADGVQNYTDIWPYDSSNGSTQSDDNDGDGISNSLDPAPSDANNFSTANGTYWYGAALEDADNDGTINFNDTYPYDQFDNQPDYDGDGWSNNDDPFPKDSSNFSSQNQTAWYGTLFQDADNDGAVNWQDEFPYDTFNNNPDFDADGITNESDPFPKDASNFSSVNYIFWYSSVLADDDNDGTPNWNDSTPYWVDTNNDSDGDGIDNSVDPFGSDASNYSSVNGISWGTNVLGDNDQDGIPNWNDPDPLDTDGDGLSDGIDPAPTDGSNYSSTNYSSWYGGALGDNDGDGINNWSDAWPYDANNGYNPDRDGDGIANDSDPAPDDWSNYSPYNSNYWYGGALGDNDGDGSSNWWDYWPNDANNGYNPDRDGDGIPNDSDPAPDDSNNYSTNNNVYWYGNPLGDNDGDGINNWSDAWPYDANNGYNPDRDGDGIANDSDPAPDDWSNFSPYNSNWWYGNALADNDGDGINNWSDSWPYDSNNGQTWVPPDSDSDGIEDNNDPAPYDSSNYSSLNGTYWYGNVFGDNDNDGTSNWWDAWPDDSSNGNNPDRDGDGIANGSDPAPDDGSNYSSYNATYWYGNALGDNDNDGTQNFYDYQPNGDSNTDSDNDGFLDSNDPAPNDYYNTSTVNGVAWGSAALNDDDADGIANFFDPTPYIICPPADNDGDGLNADEEAAWGTSDSNTDSDGDGLSDGDEVHAWGSSPANAHSISQGRGWGDLYTDAELVDNTDTDGDGLPDRIELHYGLNPNWRLDALLDRDNNGINNVTQYNSGVALDANLSTYDADDDGMTDVFEDAWQLAKHSRADATQDADGDGVLNYEEQRMLTSPQIADTLQQGGLGDLLMLMTGVRYADGSTPPTDDLAPSNGIPDWADAVLTSPTAPDYNHFTRQLAADLDGDGMPDAWEHKYGAWKHPAGGLNLRDARDAIKDPDHDGLNNLTEYRFGSDPLVGDSLHDGVSDSTRLYQKTHTTTTTGGGLMNRYRAQVAQDLFTGLSADKTVNLRSPEDNTVHPKLTITITTKVTGDTNSTTTETQELPATLVNTTTTTVHSVGCSCSYSTEYETCIVCSGTGHVGGGTTHEDVTVTCSQCDGTGSSVCWNCDGFGHFLCNDCSGSGRQGAGPCPTCFGRGFNDCIVCVGTGFLNCDVCHGSGEVTEDKATYHPPGPCDACEGLGYTEGTTYHPDYNCPVHFPPACSTCGGSGVVSDPDDPDGGTMSCPDCGGSGSKPVDSYTTTTKVVSSGVVNLEFPPGSNAHINERFPITLNGDFYVTLSKDNRSVSFGPPNEDEESEIAQGELTGEASGSIMASDSAGPRYRKIGLNGVPLSDSKPQQQDESGENPEETYIDAYSRQLRHSVSDVYSNAEGSLLPLMVRRDAQSECWNQRSGLRPEERADTPFGAGWSSNVCSYVRFEKMSPPSMAQAKVAVVDEMGAHQNFYLVGNSWVHSGEEVLDAKTAKNVFSATYRNEEEISGVMLFKKFGTTCFYEMTALKQDFPPDRQQGFSSPEEDNREHYRYARLREVRDRLGNRLVYSYPSNTSLIPSRIEDPDRPGRKVSITQQNGVITAVRGPAGETITYGYDLLGSAGGRLLKHVQRGSATVDYAYDLAVETDLTPDEASPLYFMHLDLGSITDELDRVYTFTRGGFNQEVTYEQYKRDDQQITVRNRYQTGLPRPVTGVGMPGGRSISIIGGREIHATTQAPYVQVNVAPWAQVTGAAGTYRFNFSEKVITMPAWSQQNQGGQPTAYHDPHSTTATINFTRLDVVSAAGTETYRFNPMAAMALASSTDVSGNTTSFIYGLDGYDDPLAETNALGKTKTYSYDPATRIMTSMTDALGTVTAYGITSRQIGGLYIQGLKISEVVTSLDGSTRATYYSYDHPTFHGMVTKSWTISPHPEAMPSSVSLTTLGSPTDAQGANPCWWTEVTQSTGPATEAGELAATLTSSTTVHDPSGNKRSVIDARGFITNFDYDEHLRLVQVMHPDGSHKDLQHDAHGNLLSETNENGVTTHHTYDELNRRTQTTLPLSNGTNIVTSMTYNARNQVLTQTDPRGKVTTNVYDAAGRLTSTDDGGLVTHYADYVGGGVFDSSGFKPRQVTPPSGVTTYFEYDGLYREVSRKVIYAPGQMVNPRYLSYQASAAANAAQQAAADLADAQTTAATAKALAAAKVTAVTQQVNANLQTATVAAAGAAQNLAGVMQSATAANNAAHQSTMAIQSTMNALAEQLSNGPPQAPPLVSAEAGARSGYYSALSASGAADQALSVAQSNFASIQAAFAAAQDGVTSAQNTLAEAQAALDALMSQDNFPDLTAAMTAVNDAQTALGVAQAAVPTAEAAVMAAQPLVDAAQQTASGAHQTESDAFTAWQMASTALSDYTTGLTSAAQTAHDIANGWMTALNTASNDLTAAQTAHTEAEAALELLTEGTQEYQDALDLIAATADTVTQKEGEVAYNQSQYDAAKMVADMADADLAAFNNSMADASGYVALQENYNQTCQAYAQAQEYEGMVAQEQTVHIAAAQSVKAMADVQYQAAVTAAVAVPQAAAQTAQSVQTEADAAVQAAVAAAASAATQAEAAEVADNVADVDQGLAGSSAQAQIAHDKLGALKALLAQVNGTYWQGGGSSGSSSGTPPPTTMPYQVLTETTYDDVGKPLTVTDTFGRVTSNAYNGLGELTLVVNADGTTKSTTYTYTGKPWTVTDEMGNTSTSTYDAAGRAVMLYSPAVDGVQATHITTYDAAGNVIRVTDPLGRETDTEYDSMNRAVAVFAPTVWDSVAGQFVRPVTQTTYDAMGRVLAVTDPQGNVTTKFYDEAGRNWKVVAPVPEAGQQAPVTITTFDAGGLALTVTNALGQTVTNTYDIHGRLITTEDAEHIVNHFEYDVSGNRTSVKDGLNQETTFAYDGLNRVTAQTFANGDTVTTSYDPLRKISQTSPRGITTRYAYDKRDRMLRSTATGLNRHLRYDAAGHLLSVTEDGKPAATVTYSYDALGHTTSETSRGQTHNYTYDLAGNRIRAAYGTGRSVQTSYDALNRPELISEGGRVTRYGYDLAGRAVVLVAGNGQTSNNTYDNLGRLTDRTLFKTAAMSESDVLAQFSWEHDALGNVTRQLETWPGESSRVHGIRSTAMTYDANNRLTGETVIENLSHPTVGVTTTTYTYDAANNRSSKTVTGGSDPGVWTYTYNTANQLKSWVQQDPSEGTELRSAVLNYDAAGNRISQHVSMTGGATGNGINPPPAAGGTTTYTWDSQDLLSSVTMPNGETHSYDYDYRTRRIGTHKVVSGVQQKQSAIVFAGGLSLAEYDSETSSLPTTPTVEYTRGPDMGGGVGGMLYSIRASSIQNQASSIKYSLSNGRGDIVAQADSNATLTWTASYEAYGRRTKETGSNQDKQRGNSKDEDPTGLLNEGFRYRDLETGVWLSRDPAGFVDGPNVYAYCVQNPWSKFDAQGLFWAYAVDAGFAIWDTASWATGRIDNKEYAKRMAITGASVLVNTISGGGFTGGGLVARAATTGSRVVNTTAQVVKPLATVSERAGAAAVVQASSHLDDAASAGAAAGNAASDHGSQESSSPPPANGPPPSPVTDSGKVTAAVNAADTAIPDTANVVRGGSKKPGGAASPEGMSPGLGSGVTADAAGNVHGVSVQAGTASPEVLAEGIRNAQYGHTTAGAIRNAGGTITPVPRFPGDAHAEVGNICPIKLSDLLKPAKKPPLR